MTGNVETEFKLRATRPLEIARVDAVIRESSAEVASSGSRRHNDIYLDDGLRSLSRHGIGLRVRVNGSGNGSTITCKRRGRRDGALFVREELEASWPSSTTPAAATALPEILRDAIEPIVMRRPLIPILRIDVERESRDLTVEGRDLCELVVDTVKAHGAGRSVEFSEIEMEVVADEDIPTCELLAARLEHALKVEPASRDKPTHAAHLLGIALPSGELTFDADSKTTEAIRCALLVHLGAMQQAETCARQDDAPEHVHEMRVAVRRLRTTASAFRDLWPVDEARWMRQHLRALAHELGRVRDLDVMVAALPAQLDALPALLGPGGERVATWVRDNASRARRDLLAWLRAPSRLDDGQRFAELATAFDPEQHANDGPIAKAAAATLARQATELRRCARELTEASPVEDFHAARLLAKQLRYLVDDFGDVLPTAPGPGLNKLRKRLAKLQRTLGKLCDEDTALERLAGWSNRILEDCREEPLTGPALGALMQQRLAARDARRRSVAATIERLRRKLRLPS